MKFVPLLATQRAIYEVPVNERFLKYLEVMLEGREDIRYPLQNMNPMGESHVPRLLHKYLRQGAEEVCHDRTLSKLYPELSDHSVGLVLADDSRGAWTDHVDVEYTHLFDNMALYKRNWIEALL
jgi:hypothetical protein